MLAPIALAAIGGATVSIIGSIKSENCLAHKLYPVIPRSAIPYPGYFQRQSGYPYSNNSFLGWCAFFGVATVTFGLGRLATQPLLKVLRKKYIFVPGTNVPKRIGSFIGLLYDFAPGTTVNLLPVIPAIPLATYTKVLVDGPGRFADWDDNFNPYTKRIAEFDKIYLPAQPKPTSSLRFPTDKALAALNKSQ